MKHICPACKGTGTMTDSNGVMKDEPCEVCDGTGSIEQDDEEETK